MSKTDGRVYFPADTIGTAFCNGIEDRHVTGLLRVEHLYRRPLVNRIAWRLGWEVANVLTQRALRNAKVTPQSSTEGKAT